MCRFQYNLSTNCCYNTCRQVSCSFCYSLQYLYALSFSLLQLSSAGFCCTLWYRQGLGQCRLIRISGPWTWKSPPFEIPVCTILYPLLFMSSIAEFFLSWTAISSSVLRLKPNSEILQYHQVVSLLILGSTPLPFHRLCIIWWNQIAT